MTPPVHAVLREKGEGSSATQIPAVDDGRSATMLEKAARALCRQCETLGWQRDPGMYEMHYAGEIVDDAGPLIESRVQTQWRLYTDGALAVLQAIRDADLSVITAVFDAADNLSEDGPLAVWEAGIDAILSEGAGE